MGYLQYIYGVEYFGSFSARTQYQGTSVKFSSVTQGKRTPRSLGLLLFHCSSIHTWLTGSDRFRQYRGCLLVITNCLYYNSLLYYLLQVLQVHSYGKQRRVRAVDSAGNIMSIPRDYPIEIFIEDKEKTGTQLVGILN